MADGLAVAALSTGGAIVGVIVGGLLETVRAAFVRRAQLRQERADRCAALLDAVSRSSVGLITMNRQLRDEVAGRTPSLDAEAYQRAVADFVSARQEMRKQVWLLHLSGPTVLAEAGDRVRAFERQLRDLRQEPDDEQADGRDGMPRAIRQGRAELDRELRLFADVAHGVVT